MKLKSFLLSLVAVNSIILVTTKPVHAGTAAYYSECSFIDKGPDSGGDAIAIPCYITEGATSSSAFFHILWQDGIYTLNSSNIQTGETVGDFSILVPRGLLENHEGDLIYIGELEYTGDRFNVTEAGIADRIFGNSRPDGRERGTRGD